MRARCNLALAQPIRGLAIAELLAAPIPEHRQPGIGVDALPPHTRKKRRIVGLAQTQCCGPIAGNCCPLEKRPCVPGTTGP